ncbi:MAG: class I SAM-dependent methyltransferase [Actinomycetota bacterium]
MSAHRRALSSWRARRSVSRRSLERELEPMLRALPPGVVMDVGAKDARHRRHVQATEYLTLDVRTDVGADIVGDLHEVPREDASLDIVIATEVLEHCYDPPRAVGEIRRMLRRGGVCVLSTRFIHPYHPDPKDYFRFSRDGLEHLFRDFSDVEIIPLGNRVQSAWLMIRDGRGFSRRSWVSSIRW